MKILITGAFGYTGKGLTESCAEGHSLRVMSTRPNLETPHDFIQGDVSNIDDCLRAVEGMDAIVMGHMAVRQSGSYDSPVIPFDVNVKGTANLFFAAEKAGIKRVILISSIGAVMGHPDTVYRSRDLEPKGKEMYSLTKALQERIAMHYHETTGMEIAALRVSWILDADTCTTKYGEKVPHQNAGFVDPRDIGSVARLCLERETLGYQVLYVGGIIDQAQRVYDAAYTTRFLNGWTPKYTFSNLPTEEAYRAAHPDC